MTSLSRLPVLIMGCRFTCGKGAGEKIVIMQAESMINYGGQRITDRHENTGLKRYFNFYEKCGFISNEELFGRVALFSPKTG
ncbi:hypothetical protein AB6849_16605 [Serratia proteamaculans]|uniref:hypothetical protein n=1 Tax=Serratia proteamaculans TaxID=28151 RepID=UPI001C5A404E|nr:hypothetical protein [Serratia proteamaculans]WEO91865.1 hypothetical protein JET59_011930 [Serratia proteamaculans]